MKTLDVYLNAKLIGHLIQNEFGEINFTYSSSWLNDQDAFSISCSLPLQEQTFKRRACMAFFNGILPEESQRKLIARHLGISDKNDFSMLDQIGGECAGALTFIPTGQKLNSTKNEYRKLTTETLAKTLRKLPTRPLLAGEKDIRLSLAGVQDKIAVYIENNDIYIPLNNAPSTHIIKPDFSLYEGVVFNEELCMKLAKTIGIPVADAKSATVDDIDYLIIERYDRLTKIDDQNNHITQRIHQEDFCQALGIVSAKKYQNEGGPSLKQCFDLLRQVADRPIIDINNLIDVVIFNYLIGNCDAHGKNFSLLHGKKIRLSPFYDLISTIYYKNLSTKMSMKLGGEYKIHDIKINSFDKLADEAGLSKRQVHIRIKEIIDAIIAASEHLALQNDTQSKVMEIILRRCQLFSSFLQ